MRFWLTSVRLKFNFFKVTARDGSHPWEEVWVVSAKASQNVKIKKTPVLQPVYTETTNGGQVTVQLPLESLFLLLGQKYMSE